MAKPPMYEFMPYYNVYCNVVNWSHCTHQEAEMTRRECLLVGAALSTATAQGDAPRGQWLKDSRFAMFIHWGLYSELGGHWNGKAYYGISEWIMNRARIPAGEY